MEVQKLEGVLRMFMGLVRDNGDQYIRYQMPDARLTTRCQMPEMPEMPEMPDARDQMPDKVWRILRRFD